ncbi:MAG: SBBP repeat-containing protein [Betaproteobacteria bacterium]
MAHWKRRTCDATRGVCALLLYWACAGIAPAQVPALVYSTQVYGHGNANSLTGSGDPILGKNAMAVDTAGNIYVTGSTFNGLNSDFLTVKYSPAGAILWRITTNGTGNGDDLAYAIALGPGGDVLVTGSSQSNGQSDYLTVKYDSNGVEQWRAVMDGAAQGDDFAYAIAVDAAGTVIVTGASFVGSNNFDYVTVKYSTAGTEQWRISMNGPGNSRDQAVALCLDATGNAVVTGYSLNGAQPQNYDYVTVKYQVVSGPVELWRRTLNGSTSGSDVAYAMACDASDNVYVTGQSFNITNNVNQFLTVKYAGGGSPQWQTVTPITPLVPANLTVARAAYAIAVDAAGNVIVNGSQQDKSGNVSVTNPAHLTVNYNAGGVEQWRSALNGSGTSVDVYTSLSFDAAGNIYTTGFADNAGSNELIVVKYSPAGTELWRSFIDGVGSTNSAALTSLRIDGVGNVIVAGYRSNGLDNDFLVVKLDGNGLVLWRADEGENTGLATVLASDLPGINAVVADSAGNVYVTGQSGLAANADFITAKIGSNGVEQWRARLNGPSGGVDRAYAIAADGSGNVYVAGDSFAGGYSDFMTVKYDAAGAEMWRRQPGHVANSFNSARAVAVDGAGDVIVGGYASAGADFFTIKYNSNGFEQWSRVANGAANGADIPVAMAVDAALNIVVAGRSSDGVNDGYLTIKYNAAGTEQWRNSLYGSGSQPQQPYALAIDAAGNVYVAGDSIVKYDLGGVEQWHVTDTFRSYSIAVGSDGTVAVGGTGGLIVSYDSGGAEKWRGTMSGTVNGNDVVYSVAVDIDGSIYATGRNTADPGAGYLTIKFGADGNERWRLTSPTAGGGATGSPAMILDASRNVIVAGNALTGGMPSAILIIKLSQAPRAPVNVTAVAGNGVALVSFTPPAASDSPVSGFTVTCQPGNVTAGGTVSPILVSGLSNNVTYACSVTATNAFGVGPASVAAGVTPLANPPLALFGVKSTKAHGSAGDFALSIDLAQTLGGAVTVEPRSPGAAHKLVFQFNNTIANPGTVAAVDGNSMSVGNSSALASGNDVVVTLSGVPDNQRLQVTLTGVNGSINAVAAVGFMVGNVNNTRSVNAADISGVKAQVGQTVNSANFRLDIDASGSITSLDLSAVKTRSGSVLN